jgi:hypothetical protein
VSTYPQKQTPVDDIDRTPVFFKVGIVVVSILVALAIFGCAGIGLAAPKGFDQQLAESYGVHTAVLSATATAVTAGSISSTEASLVQSQAMKARQLLDTAKAIESTNPAGATNDLQLATSALVALQTYLNSQAAKGK